MIDEAYISQLEKQYKNYLRNIIAGNPFETVILRGGKNRPQSTVELHKLTGMFQKHDKDIHKKGWHIEWEAWYSKKLGRQQWPSVIRVDTEEDYLFLINKQRDSAEFKEQLGRLLAWKPAIGGFLSRKPESVLELKEAWEGICGVVDYLLCNNVSDHYIRSLPVPVHTKFIHQHKSTILALLQYLDPHKFSPGVKELEEALALKRKPFLFTIRWLDNEPAALYCAGIEVMGISAETLDKAPWNIRRIILVENETNLYLLPPISCALAIFTCGKALHLLKEISLFKEPELYYWGDLDEDGFIMLNDMRSYYSHVKSIFMDDATVSFHLAGMAKQPLKYKGQQLDWLTQPERLAYEKMWAANGRIEQEKLQQAYIMNKLLTL